MAGPFAIAAILALVTACKASELKSGVITFPFQTLFCRWKRALARWAHKVQCDKTHFHRQINSPQSVSTTTVAAPSSNAPNTSASSTSSTASGGSRLGTAIDDNILAIFNDRRTEAGADPLTIDPVLKNLAQKCADLLKWRYQNLDPSANFDYNTYETTACEVAENAGHLQYFCIASQTAADRTAAVNECATRWADSEKNDYNPTDKQYNEAALHYTQIIWKSTKRVGCAVSERNIETTVGNSYALVCLFDPPGNTVVGFSPTLAFKNNV